MRGTAIALVIALSLTACGVRSPAPNSPGAAEPPAPPQVQPPAGTPGTRSQVAPVAGFRAPSIAGVDANTMEHVGLGEMRGKVVLLNFFATWCLPCLREMPEMETIAKEMAAEVRVVAIGADHLERPPKLKEFADGLGVTFTVLYDEGEAAQRYRVLGLPTSFFIDQDGYVRARIDGPMTETMMRKQIDSILKGSG